LDDERAQKWEEWVKKTYGDMDENPFGGEGEIQDTDLDFDEFFM